MTTTKITLDGSDFYIVPSGFEFVNQSCVKFYGFRLSKKQLVTCCDHFISLLQLLGYSDRLEIGFNLKCFKYFELSVYLHGLVQLYCSILDEEPLGEFHITRFSRLPHDILKADTETLVIEVATVKDPEGPLCYCCVIGYIPICSRSIEGLKKRLLARFPHWKSKYNILLNVK